MTQLKPRQLNIADAARYLEISRRSVYRRLEEEKLSRDPVTAGINITQLKLLKRQMARQQAWAARKRVWRQRARPLRRALRHATEAGRGVVALLIKRKPE